MDQEKQQKVFSGTSALTDIGPFRAAVKLDNHTAEVTSTRLQEVIITTRCTNQTGLINPTKPRVIFKRVAWTLSNANGSLTKHTEALILICRRPFFFFFNSQSHFCSRLFDNRSSDSSCGQFIPRPSSHTNFHQLTKVSSACIKLTICMKQVTFKICAVNKTKNKIHMFVFWGR